MWPIRIALARLRPFNAASVTRLTVVASLFLLFLWGDYALCIRLFRAVGRVEEATPFFAIGLLHNLLALIFLTATVVLFSSSMTAAIGAFFTDLDLDTYHAAPVSRLLLILARWFKTLVQSAAIVFAFLVPLLIAFARQYELPPSFVIAAAGHLFLLLTLPVSAASTVILLLVRFFPVRRVHQIVATLAIIVLTLAVTAFRMSRPERLFTNVGTDDLVTVLRAVELPSIDLYPSTALADLMSERARGDDAASILFGGGGSEEGVSPTIRLGLPAAILFALFVAVARATYFRAFVRARESMAPVALGSAAATRIIDRLLQPFDPQTRALASKEIRILVRDVAQWSQLFLMLALMFIYLYNIRMLPLAGDVRAAFVAYLNVGMAGFVVSAIALRFAYPSVSGEGKAFWVVRSAPTPYRRLLLVKAAVYAAPLLIVSLLLTILANWMLGAAPVVWLFTLIGSSLLALTLVCLAVGMGSWAPDFGAENPLQVGLSLGGFAYMAISLGYVGIVMLLMARPLSSYFFSRVLGIGTPGSAISVASPVILAVAISLVLMIVPLAIGERRLARRDR